MYSSSIREFFDKQVGYGTSTTGVPSSPSSPIQPVSRSDKASTKISQTPVASTTDATSPHPALSASDHLAIPLTPYRTLLKVCTRRHPQTPALSIPSQPADLYPQLSFARSDGSHLTNAHLSWTYAQLEHASCLLAPALHSLGVRRGHLVTTLLPPSAELVLLFWACIRLGADFSPREQPSRVLDLPQGSVLVVAENSAAELWDASAGGKEDGLKLRVVARDLTREETRDGWMSLGTLLRIWELNANYILKSVDGEANGEDMDSDHILSVVKDDGGGGGGGEMAWLTSAELMEQTNEIIAAEPDSIAKGKTVVLDSLTTRKGLLRMAAAFRVGATCTVQT